MCGFYPDKGSLGWWNKGGGRDVALYNFLRPNVRLFRLRYCTGLVNVDKEETGGALNTIHTSTADARSSGIPLY